MTAYDLPIETIDRITEVLRPYVSERRQARIASALASRTRDVVLVLEDIYSDHNTSAVLRSADAIGIFELHVVAGKSPFTISRKVTSGAHKWLDMRRHAQIEDAYRHLRERGYETWASHFHGDAVDVDSIPTDRPVALVFGNEHEGLSPAAIEGADRWFRVPMRGFVESLNISVAAAISMYDVHARRLREGRLTGLHDQDARRVRAAWFAGSVRAAAQLLAQAGLPLPEMPKTPMIFAEEDDEG